MKETDPVKKASEIQEKMQQWNMEDVIGNIPPLPKARNVVRKSGVIGGMTHTWVEYVPPCYDGTTAVPLLVGLHGGSNNGEHFAATTLFTDIADRENFICLFPEASHYYDDEQGRHHIWNSYYFLEAGKSETETGPESDDRRVRHELYLRHRHVAGHPISAGAGYRLQQGPPRLLGAGKRLAEEITTGMLKESFGGHVPSGAFFMRVFHL